MKIGKRYKNNQIAGKDNHLAETANKQLAKIIVSTGTVTIIFKI